MTFLFQLRLNYRNYSIDVVENIIIPKPQDCISTTIQVFCSFFIFIDKWFSIVLAPICFYNQSIFKINEIDYVRTNGLLPSELYTFYLSISQPIPEFIFSI